MTLTLTDLWIGLPLLLLASGALLVLLSGALFPGRIGTIVAIVVALGAGLWPLQMPPLLPAATMGLAATPLSRFFTVFFCLLAAAVLLLSLDYNEKRKIRGEEYPATVLFTTFGMVAMTCATNLLTLFLGLEAMTFGFYILVAVDLNREAASEAGLKYLLLGAVSAAFLAFGIAIIYAATGSLEFVRALQGGGSDHLVLAGWGFILVGIAFKLSLVPAHLWTPDVYQEGAAPVIAFLSAGSKGAAVLLLLMLLPAVGNPSFLRPPLWVIALFSMVVGNLAGLLQTRVRRMLAYSSIAQMGYVVLAIVSGSSGYQAAAFYIVAYGVMSLAVFGAIASLERQGCGENVVDYSGLGFTRPLPAAMLAVGLFALAGVPPTAGFTGKFFIFSAALRGGETTLAIIGILTAAISVYYYLRVVVNLYMHQPQEQSSSAASPGEIIVLVVVVAIIFILGLFPSALVELFKNLFP
jgi:NADH-quinone oxidoreductase subunit N